MNFNANGASRNTVNVGKSALVFIGLGVVIVIVLLINVFATAKLKEKVDVVQLKESVAQNQLITEDNLQKVEMYAAEFKKVGEVVLSDGSTRSAVVRWDERQNIVGGYAAYYIRKNTCIYWDALTHETQRKNSYLYKMDGELLKLDVSADVFGEMVVPGDRVNIRCIYTETNYNLPTVAEYEAMEQLGLQMNTTTEVQTKLFSGVSVLDMLNSNGESIFDIYYNLINLSTSEQQAMLNSSEFKEKTAPSQILLCVTAEEADMYMRIANKNPQYMLTLLPREGSNLILDALAALEQ
jgi:hypothetical protein